MATKMVEWSARRIRRRPTGPQVDETPQDAAPCDFHLGQAGCPKDGPGRKMGAPLLGERGVDLHMKLKAIGPGTHPECLMGKHPCRRQVLRPGRKGEGVMVVVAAGNGGVGQSSVLRAQHPVPTTGSSEGDSAHPDLCTVSAGDLSPEG